MAIRGREEGKASPTPVHAVLVAQHLDWGIVAVLAHNFLDVLHHKGLAGECVLNLVLVSAAVD